MNDNLTDEIFAGTPRRSKSNPAGNESQITTKVISTVLLISLHISLLSTSALPQINKNSQSGRPIVFTHVNVIDATGRPPMPDMTIIITGDRIIGLGKTGKISIPKDAQVVDCTDKFLIPGLWDMHVHLSLATEAALPALIANGVTGVRDMGGDLKQIDDWRERIVSGKLLGPRIVRAGPVVDGPKDAEYRVTITNPKEAVEAVLSLKRSGVDFIKIHNAVPRDAYFALARECKRQHISFVGHIPAGISPAEASDAGQRSIEHTESLMDYPVAEAMKSTKDLKKIFNQAITAYNEDKTKVLFEKFVKNDTWFVPTLVEYHAFAFRADLADDPDYRNKYVAVSTKDYWNKTFPVRGTAEIFAVRKEFFQKFLGLVSMMRREGVSVMAGTDLGARDIYPGFSLHDELDLLVKSGFSPMEALQTATRNPARFLGRLLSSGTIEKSKIADLVLLEANPLENIQNTRKIAAVVLRGKLILKPELQMMLDKLEADTKQK